MNEDDFFEFKLPDGSKRKLTLHHARSFGCKEMTKRADEIMDAIRSKWKKQYKKDGFIPGWQENIRMHITCPHQYKRALKDLGLVEIGYDYIPQASNKEFNVFDNDAVIKATLDAGIYLSGNEIEAMKSGEYFKDLEPIQKPT